MKKLSLSAVLLALFVSVGFGQQVVTDDYHKVEVFGGYSLNTVDVAADDNDDFFDNRVGFNGFNASVVGNFSRYVGVKGDVSGHYKTLDGVVESNSGTTNFAQNIEARASLYNFLGGVQIKDNRKEGSRFRPFGHALAGVARGNINVEPTVCIQVVGVVCPSQLSQSDYGLAAAIGGGLDIKATNRLSIRAVQADYNPTRLNGSTQQNFRFGVGLVFH